MKAVIIGGGKVVYFLAKVFISKGYEPVIIDQDKEDCLWLSQQLKAMVLHGDGSRPALLEEAGAREAVAVLAVTPRDQDNLVACQLAAKMFGVPRTLALVNDPENQEVFHRLGVSVAFSTTHIMATLIEQQAGLEEVVNLLPVAQGKVTVTELLLHQGLPSVGRTMQELDMPAGSLIGAVIRGEQVMVPRGPDRLQDGDRLLLISTPESYGPALRCLMGKEV
ncbi:MAG: TrkA family potassium uptake protein [Desulfarculus sp.]|jgi:trk system potassium uptake protein TrkA|nr:MAG: TrkA family potassium uptake protein [Desulfarculus sp.]